MLPAEQLCLKIARRRAQWKKCQGWLDPMRLVFIDESRLHTHDPGIMGQEGTKTNMAPLRGWASKGQRLHAKAPYGHCKTRALLAALRCDRIDATCFLDQPINGDSFLDYVQQCLIPTLSAGNVDIMDNLSSHKRPAVRNAIQSVGARLMFLPPYNPDLNPSEQVFAKLQASDAQSCQTNP